MKNILGSHSKYVVAALMALAVSFVPVGPDGYQTSNAFLGIPFSLGTVTKAVLGWTGGKISDEELEFCLIPIPGLPFPIPYPFLYIEINTTVFTAPNAALHLIPYPKSKLYYLFLISQLYADWEMIPNAKAISNYVRGADAAFRAICENGADLPKADGIIFRIGTACADGTGDCYYGNGDLLSAQKLFNSANDPSSSLKQFNPGNFSSYGNNFCSLNSATGTCTPVVLPSGGGLPTGCNSTCVLPPSP